MDNHQVVLGLCFHSSITNEEPYYRRNYEISDKSNGNNTFVDEITETFIEEGYDSTHQFPKDTECVAIYVCNGARLAVMDGGIMRYDKNKQNVENDTTENLNTGKQHHCGSLMQQGSLVVVHNCNLRLTMGIAENRKKA